MEIGGTGQEAGSTTIQDSDDIQLACEILTAAIHTADGDICFVHNVIVYHFVRNTSTTLQLYCINPFCSQ